MLSVSAGFANYSRLANAEKLFVWLLGMTLVTEITAFIFFINGRNNMPLYQIFGLVYYLVIVQYFSTSLKDFPTRFVFRGLQFIGVTAFVLNLLFLQPLNVFSSHFFMMMSVVIICLCLLSFYRLLSATISLNLAISRRFWIDVILIVFWSITFLNWGLYNVLHKLLEENFWWVRFMLLTINVVTYFALGFVLSRKHIESHDN